MSQTYAVLVCVFVRALLELSNCSDQSGGGVERVLSTLRLFIPKPLAAVSKLPGPPPPPLICILLTKLLFPLRSPPPDDDPAAAASTSSCFVSFFR